MQPSNRPDNQLRIFDAKQETDIWEATSEAVPSLTTWGIEQLRSGLEKYVKTIVLEPNYICKDHRNLHSNFYSKKFRPRSPNCARLHFFSRSGLTQADLLLNSDSLDEDYIGYTVLRPVSERCLGRTVIDPYKVGRSVDDGFFLLRTKFSVHLNGQRLSAHGYPYTSQDTEATVCAHAALWGMCRYLSERYSVYPETYPFDLIQQTSDTAGRVVPYRGMTYTDYSHILSNFGCHPVVLMMRNASENPDPERFEDLCAYVESGFPVLTSFRGHVATLIGHTINTGANPDPDSDGCINSSAFLKQFVVVDDNCFPYQTLGYRDDPENYGRTFASAQYSIESIFAAVCPLPEKVYLPADKARQQACTILSELRATYSDEVNLGHDEPLVVRLFATTSSSLKRRKVANLVHDGKIDPWSLKVSQLHFPHFVWVMEAGPLSEYRQGNCSTEIVLDATANSMETAILYARAGSIFVLTDGLLRTTKPLNTVQTFPQYTHNLGER